MTLKERFPPSESCQCEICVGYCRRPGWWSLEEFERVLQTGYIRRVMLEMSPELDFGVPSPAFHGCENDFAREEFAAGGCCFLNEGLCALHSAGLMPLECRFCRHDRKGKGQECHGALEAEWNSAEGRKLVLTWMKLVQFRYLNLYLSWICR